MAVAGLRLLTRRRALLRAARRRRPGVGRCHSTARPAVAPAAEEPHGVEEGPLAELSRKWGQHSLTPEDVEQLRQGRPVQRQERQGPTGSGLVVFEVNAPPSVVMGCLESFENYPQMIPVVRQAELESTSVTTDGSILANLNYRISKFWLSLSVVHVVDSAARTVRFGLGAKSSRVVLRRADGFWQVEEAPGSAGRSRVWLRVSLRASSMLPTWIIDYAAERALRRATSWLGPYTEELWRKRQVSQLWKDETTDTWRGLKSPPAGQLQPSVA